MCLIYKYAVKKRCGSSFFIEIVHRAQKLAKVAKIAKKIALEWTTSGKISESSSLLFPRYSPSMSVVIEIDSAFIHLFLWLYRGSNFVRKNWNLDWQPHCTWYGQKQAKTSHKPPMELYQQTFFALNFATIWFSLGLENTSLVSLLISSV